MDPGEVKVIGKEGIASKIWVQLGSILTNLLFSFVVYAAQNLQPKKGDGEFDWFCISVDLSDGSKIVNASCCVLFFRFM